MAPDPNLSPWEAADVAASAEDLAPDAQPPYGTPLSEVIAEYHEGVFGGSEWLEAAVIAGHVPYLEGIVLALHETSPLQASDRGAPSAWQHRRRASRHIGSERVPPHRRGAGRLRR